MKYIYPPRPKSTIPPHQLPSEEARGIWIWQPKFDGDRCVSIIEVSKQSRKVVLCNRHGKFHSPNNFPRVQQEFLSADLQLPVGLHYLDGELLSNDKLVLFDVLQITTYLIGVSQEERLKALATICGNPTELCNQKIALRVTDHILLGCHGDQDFSSHFKEQIQNPFIEGLVLRRKGSTLDNWGSREYEVDWQLRCRKPTKNYRY